MNKILTVTVNYKTPELTIKCIESVARERELNTPGLEMCIVDNDSQDGSVEKIAAAVRENGWSEWVEVLPAGRNGGFSFGNNVAIRPALARPRDQQPDFIWLLNPDSEVEPGAALELIKFMQAHPRAGMTTGLSYGVDGEVQTVAYRRFSPLTEFVAMSQIGVLERLMPFSNVVLPLGDEPSQAVWLSGASLMIRREVFDDTGLMDEDYFLYFEETDLCIQAGRAGWEMWYVPASRVMHIEGAATGFTLEEVAKPRRARYWFESRRRFFRKNYGLLVAMLADLGHLSGYMLWRLRRKLQNKPDLDPPFYLRDFVANSIFLAGFRRGGGKPATAQSPERLGGQA